MQASAQRSRIGILGATGLVGQRLVRALEGHPWFEVGALGASARSAGRRYAEATRWSLPGDPPPDVADEIVRPCDPGAFSDCDAVLASLDASTAREVEPAFADRGYAVISNSSALRMAENCPLIVPEVNAGHLEILRDRDGGFVVTNPNCSVVGLVLALAPLHRAFGVRRVVVTTLQAISGAGVDGPSALEMLDNVVPFIGGEEDKLETEVARILGSVRGGREIVPAAVAVSPHCHRVQTLDGHLEAVSVEFDRRASVESVAEAMRAYRGEIEGLDLPSAPDPPLVIRSEPDRPQPRLDRDAGGGMAVVVGRIRPCPVFDVRFEVLSHNTVRGAAGAAILNLELLRARGLLVENPAR